MLDLKPRDHISSALRELHWLPISERVVYKLCFSSTRHHLDSRQTTSQTYSSQSLLAATSSRSSLRDASRGDYVVPRTNRKMAYRAFSTAAPRAWTSCRLNWKVQNRHLLFAEDWKRFFSLVGTVLNNTWYNDYVMRPRSYCMGLRNTKIYVNVNGYVCATGHAMTLSITFCSTPAHTSIDSAWSHSHPALLTGIDSLPNYTPDVVNWIEIVVVRRPQIWHGGCLHSATAQGISSDISDQDRGIDNHYRGLGKTRLSDIWCVVGLLGWVSVHPSQSQFLQCVRISACHRLAFVRYFMFLATYLVMHLGLSLPGNSSGSLSVQH